MNTKEIIDAYYQSVNRGDWNTWLTLFGDNVVIDEQLAGHVEGIATLRGAVDGIRTAYAKFQNVPRHIVIDGDQAAVVSHISAVSASNVAIEAEVANYFRMESGKIVYMANFHDTRPFAPLTQSR